MAVPKHNRVTPLGDIIATPERGTFMGNRGVLHDAEGRIQPGLAVEAVDRVCAGVPRPRSPGDDAGAAHLAASSL